MKHKILKIYREIGQFDNVCNITFYKDSMSYQKYGSDILGELFYTKEERIDLQEKLNQNEENDWDGDIKLITNSKELSKPIKEELIRQGFQSKDVSKIIYDTEKEKNKYTNHETRILPKPIVIEYDESCFDPIHTFLWLNNKRKELGLNLTYFEIQKEIAYRIILNQFEISVSITNEYTDSKINQLNSSIRYVILEYKFLNKLLCIEERIEFAKMMNQKGKENYRILEKELNKATEKIKKLGIDYQTQLTTLLNIASSFEPERLSNSNVPVWWNLERFLHIFMRHVAEVKIGERFKNSTVFQYKLTDIRRLLKNIIERLAPEINQHFNKLSNKDFKRHGKMSIYYEGDFYALHIRKDGLLMTFYKCSAKS